MKIYTVSSAALAAVLLWPTHASAQSGEQPATAVDASSDQVLGDIVVTARKREEALQTVPIAVSALSSENLEQRGFKNLTDVAFSMPNVVLTSQGSNPNSAGFSIRGLGTNSSVQSVESAVGTFVDGAYLAVNAGVVSDSFDIEKVEVLRGPQGTLFGRNVTGGAVLISTKRPSNSFAGEFLLRGSTGAWAPADGEFVAGAAVTGPLSSTISARLAAYYRHDDGFGNNRGLQFLPSIGKSNKRSPDTNSFFIRPSILWEPSDSVSMLVRYEHFESEGTSFPDQTWGNFSPDTFDFASNFPGDNYTHVDNITAELNIDIGPGTLTNLFNHREMDDLFAFDGDGTIGTSFHASAFTHSSQWSNELRYSGKLGQLDFTVGAFGYLADLKSIESRQLAAGPQSGGGVQKTESVALFTENQWHITPQLSVIFGARYTYEKKKAEITQINAAAKCGTAFPAIDSTCIVDARNEKSWNLFGFKLGGQYEFSRDVMAYGSFTRAYRSGGFNVRQALPIAPIPFDPEGADSIELGMKATYLDGKARTNIALFQTKVSDFQRNVTVPIPVLPNFTQTTANAANIRYRGFELEQTFRPTSGLLISGHVGYVDGKITKALFDLNNDGAVNGADLLLKPARAPKWSYGAQFSYTVPVGANDLIFFTSYDHTDANFFTDDNLGIVPAVDMLNARLSLELTSGLTVAVFANNLLNDRIYGVVARTPFLDRSGRFPIITTPGLPASQQGTQSLLTGRPRTIGAEVRFAF